MEAQRDEGAQFVVIELKSQLKFSDYKSLAFSIDLFQPFWLSIHTHTWSSTYDTPFLLQNLLLQNHKHVIL